MGMEHNRISRRCKEDCFLNRGIMPAWGPAGYAAPLSVRGVTQITSNLPFDEWTETLGSERITGCIARPHRAPRQHPQDERRQRSSRPKPRPRGLLKPLENRNIGLRPRLELCPADGLNHCTGVAEFRSAVDTTDGVQFGVQSAFGLSGTTGTSLFEQARCRAMRFQVRGRQS